MRVKNRGPCPDRVRSIASQYTLVREDGKISEINTVLLNFRSLQRGFWLGHASTKNDLNTPYSFPESLNV